MAVAWCIIKYWLLLAGRCLIAAWIVALCAVLLVVMVRMAERERRWDEIDKRKPLY